MLAAAAVLGTAGCTRDTERLVADEEIEHLRARTLAAAQDNKERQCERPVLRGEPRAGPADEALIAVMTLEGPLSGCAAALEDIEALSDEIAPTTDDGDQAPRVAAPLGDEPGPREQAIVAACAALPAAVTRAASHRDACSSFSPGRRGAPSMRPFIHSAYAISAHLRAMTRAGDALGAAQLGFDHVRIQQDLLRGGGNWLFSMSAVATLYTLLPQLELVLSHPSLDDEMLETLAAELDALAGTELHVAEILRGDALWLDLYQSLPAFMPDGWQPPGGWPSGFEPSPPEPGIERIAEVETFSIDERDDAALAWLATDGISRAHLEACPPNASFEACAAALDRVAERFAEKASARRSPGTSGGAVARREAVLAILKGVAAPSLRRYVERYALRPAALAALRTRVEARRLVPADGACPPRAAFDEPPLAPLLSPPDLGGQLSARAGEGGAIELWPPDWLAETDRFAPIVRVRCDAGAN